MNRHQRLAAAAKARKKKPGRPKGARIHIAHDRKRFAVAAWWAFGEFGFGPYQSAGLAAAIVQNNEPIRMEDVEGLLTVASTRIHHNASSLKEHLAWLARKAEAAKADAWLIQSATAVHGLILFITKDDTAGACRCLDALLALGWEDVLDGLHARIDVALKGNMPPRDDKLGRAGSEFLARFRESRSKTQTKT
jgi:hypothetical protein